MRIEDFVGCLQSEFYTGVPDSLLKPLCNYLMDVYGIDAKHHVIAANEGNCTAMAAGYHLATGKIPVVYMQNSGQGNAVNPIASLLHDKVYAIPCIFVVGWRGEPGVHDEPQHCFQGEITLKLLEDMDIAYMVISKETTRDELIVQMNEYQRLLSKGKCVAFVVRKGALSFDKKMEYSNSYSLLREEVMEMIVEEAKDDPIISTTGKASRELYEIRDRRNQSHQYDFLTVGSMGHSSSIALEVAVQKPETKVWCVDGDGAALMHMGAMAVIGSEKPSNLIHICINNQAHETVGGLPTVAADIDFSEIAKACGYLKTYSVSDKESLLKALKRAKQEHCLTFIEVRCGIGAREDLGRPKTTARENKELFMEYMRSLS